MKRSPVWMLSGRPAVDDGVPVDFLLPGIPWFDKALARAQPHCVDFGFAKLPCLTVEDIVISKLYALKNRSDRFKDLDDLQNIFAASHDWELDYLRSEMTALRLVLPKGLKNSIPEKLRRALL